MTHTIQIAFYGKWKPMHWEADTFEAAYSAAEAGLAHHPLLYLWLEDVRKEWLNYDEYQRQHNSFSMSNGIVSCGWQPRPFDHFLDKIVADYPENPNVSYTL